MQMLQFVSVTSESWKVNRLLPLSDMAAECQPTLSSSFISTLPWAGALCFYPFGNRIPCREDGEGLPLLMSFIIRMKVIT